MRVARECWLGEVQVSSALKDMKKAKVVAARSGAAGELKQSLEAQQKRAPSG